MSDIVEERVRKALKNCAILGDDTSKTGYLLFVSDNNFRASRLILQDAGLIEELENGDVIAKKITDADMKALKITDMSNFLRFLTGTKTLSTVDDSDMVETILTRRIEARKGVMLGFVHPDLKNAPQSYYNACKEAIEAVINVARTHGRDERDFRI